MVSTKNTLIGKTAELLKKKKKPVEEIPAPTPWAPPQQEQPSEAPNPNVNRKILVTLPNGSTVFMGPAEYNDYIARGKTPFEEALTTMQEKVVIGRKQEALKPLISQIGQTQQLPEQNNLGVAGVTPGDVLQTAPDVLANIGMRAGQGAAVGALGGLAVGGVGALPGAAIGAAGGAIVGAFSILSELKEDAIQNVKVEKIAFSEAESNIKAIIDGVNKGVIDPVEAVGLYNRELEKIDRTERKLKAMAEKDWLSKAKDDLVRIQYFNDVGRQQTQGLLTQALLKPNPTATYNFQVSQEVTE